MIASAVESLGEKDVERVVTVLSDAFSGYPVMRWVLGRDDAHDLRTLVRMFVMARVLRNEPLFGSSIDGELAAAAVVSYPDGGPSPAAFVELRADVWRRLGAQAEARYAAYGEATGGFAFDFPHVHLNMVGVRDGFRGRGLARRLIDAVQDLSRRRPGSLGVTLTTETAANEAYYRKLGFRDAGHAKVSAELESWGFFRPD